MGQGALVGENLSIYMGRGELTSKNGKKSKVKSMVLASK
jgi:hypothetical protein